MSKVVGAWSWTIPPSRPPVKSGCTQAYLCSRRTFSWRGQGQLYFMFHTFLTPALHGNVWSTTRHMSLYSPVAPYRTHRMWDSVDPKTGIRTPDSPAYSLDTPITKSVTTMCLHRTADPLLIVINSNSNKYIYSLLLFTVDNKHLFSANNEIRKYNTRSNNNLHPALAN